MTLHRWFFAIALVIVTVGSVLIKTSLTNTGGSNGESNFNIGGPFSLTDQNGRRVTEQSWPGKILLMYFGYRFCPDVCPTSLQTISAALNLLGPELDRVQPLFVTVDPHRDTVATLTDYVTLFHPKIVGLTGTDEDISIITKLFKVYYKLLDDQDKTTYSVDHSAYTYMVNDKGKVLGIFGHSTDAESMAAAIRAALQKLPSKE